MTQPFDEQDQGPEQDPITPGSEELPIEAASHEPNEEHFEEHEPRGGRSEGGPRRDRDRDRERRPRIESFEQMKVWQEAHALTMKVFGTTPRLPADQQAGLALQMEQAAVAVPRTIAEGFKRRGPRNKAHFYNLAQTSLEALRYYFILCRDLGYDFGYDDLAHRTEQVSKMLDGLVRSMMR